MYRCVHRQASRKSRKLSENIFSILLNWSLNLISTFCFFIGSFSWLLSTAVYGRQWSPESIFGRLTKYHIQRLVSVCLFWSFPFYNTLTLLIMKPVPRKVRMQNLVRFWASSASQGRYLGSYIFIYFSLSTRIRCTDLTHITPRPCTTYIIWYW